MKILLYILIAFMTPFALVYLYALGYAFYLMITGKDKTPDIQHKMSVQKRLNAIRKIRRRKRLQNLIPDSKYPPPLDRWYGS